MEIEKYFLSKEQSTRLREIGFNEPCLMYWDNKDQLKQHTPPHYYKNSIFISTPMLDQVRDWFNRVYNVYGYIEKYELGYGISIIMNGKDEEVFGGVTYSGYKYAMENLIENCILLIKREQDRKNHLEDLEETII